MDPHPVLVGIREKKDYTRVQGLGIVRIIFGSSYIFYFTTVTGWEVLLSMHGNKAEARRIVLG